MENILTAEELRVLGALLEKKMTTPDYYPLSLNALINACNQKVNREPVVSFGDATVLRALKGLKEKELVRQTTLSRVPKYEERYIEQANIAEDEAAIMCVLMLRGPQTVGELRARTDRMVAFHDLEDVNDVLETLIQMNYVQRLPRQPGQKESRYQHLLGENEEVADSHDEELAVEGPSIKPDRVEMLEKQVATLSAELHELKQQFVEFKRQFE
jgi:uncharacterized protein YceH (UPF0502 family)